MPAGFIASDPQSKSLVTLDMSTLAEIEDAIAQLSLVEAEHLQEWLEQWLEDQQQITPEFLASIQTGQADLADGRHRTVEP